jgi:cell wall-associated NlpC family hydrolase
MKIAAHIISYVVVFTLFLLFVPGYSSTSAQTSGCAVTKVGDPVLNVTIPPECAIVTGGGPIAQKAVELARQQIGKPYVWAAPSRNWASRPPSNAPPSFDCSGLTGWAYYWASEGKISMNGQTWADWKDNAGNGSTTYQRFSPAQRSQLQPGDLLYWRSPGLNGDQIHHTAIYSGACKRSPGNDCFIEAKGTAWGIVESHLNSRLGGNDPFAGFLRPVLQ